MYLMEKMKIPLPRKKSILPENIQALPGKIFEFLHFVIPTYLPWHQIFSPPDHIDRSNRGNINVEIWIESPDLFSFNQYKIIYSTYTCRSFFYNYFYV